jgi:hypothetical protein
MHNRYGNVVAEIGIVNNKTAGDYLIRSADDVAAAPGYYNTSSLVQSVLPGLEKSTEYAGVVNLPTTTPPFSYGCLSSKTRQRI